VNPGYRKLDQNLQVTNILVCPLPLVMRLVVAKPYRPAGTVLDPGIVNEAADAIAEWDFSDARFVSWPRLNAVVFDEKLKGFAVTDACYLLQSKCFRRRRL
jgi:hypothetical protein